MKLVKHIKKYVEGELSNYAVNQKALQQAKQNLYLQYSASGYQEMPRGNTQLSSPVENRVIGLMTDRKIVLLENSVAVIREVYQGLPDEYRKLIELKYFKGCNNQYVADELAISLRTFYHWRDKALVLFAMGFGLV